MTDHRTVRKIQTAITAGTLFLALAAPALAGFSDATGLTGTAGAAGLSAFSGNLPEIIGRFVGALVGLLGVIFVVLLVYGGFTWMTAQGSEEKIKKAKNIITSAVVGLVVVFASYTIANAVIDALSSATSSAPPAAEPPPGP